MCTNPAGLELLNECSLVFISGFQISVTEFEAEEALVASQGLNHFQWVGLTFWREQ